MFLRHLAEDQEDRAIGIIMSGMGSNGTAGAQAIKAVGGVCIAQDPETAKFPSMPRSLLDAGFRMDLKGASIRIYPFCYYDYPFG